MIQRFCLKLTDLSSNCLSSNCLTRVCLGSIVGILCVLNSVSYSQQPTLADLWANRASFVSRGEIVGFNGLHFLSTWWEGENLYAYYVTDSGKPLDGKIRFYTGLATSKDGIKFSDHGPILRTGGTWQWEFRANGGLSHQLGRPDNRCQQGWSASTNLDSTGFLTFGPYISSLSEGPYTASYALLIDNNSADNGIIATIDVNDRNSNKVITKRDIRRKDFRDPFVEQIFNLEFHAKPGQMLEFRTYYHDISYLCQRAVGVHEGHGPFRDEIIASFPGIWKDDNTWYVAYEGTSPHVPGEIRLATSTDGVNWIKYPEPILKPFASWNQVNIGTPSLWKEGRTWYLFFHGYDDSTLKLGVASGNTLFNLTLVNGNKPILSGSGWDGGTLGKRSIIKEGSYYYMVYEGSTLRPPGETDWNTARWSTGIARSKDLINWEKFPGNPILPQTSPYGFGNDGPEFVRTPDGQLHVYYRTDGNRTARVTLTFNSNNPASRVAKGNFIGNQTCDLVVWRPPTGMWHILPTESHFDRSSSRAIQLGLPGDIPVYGNLDNDDRDDLIVWRPSNGTWYYRLSTEDFSRILSKQWGGPGDIPVPGDYSGDGKTDFAVWRPKEGKWYVYGHGVTQWGLPDDIPVPGDYDGNRVTDFAVWRPHEGNWYIRGQGTTQWGLSSDVPVNSVVWTSLINQSGQLAAPRISQKLAPQFSHWDIDTDGRVDVSDLMTEEFKFREDDIPAILQAMGLSISDSTQIQTLLSSLEQVENPSQGVQLVIYFFRFHFNPKTALFPNYPNPFNPETWIPYQLSSDASVTLTIYDATGKLVRTINVGHRSAGIYRSKERAIYWDGRNDNGERVASGVYFYNLTANGYTATQKMVTLK
jgi:hypothetical protein